MGLAARKAAPCSLPVLLLVCSCLYVAQASRFLQQVNSCVVLGSTLLRNCNNPTCNCQGKSSSGNNCKCRGECDPSYKKCDGNENNQANCDCSGGPLGAGAASLLAPNTPAGGQQQQTTSPAKTGKPAQQPAATTTTTTTKTTTPAAAIQTSSTAPASTPLIGLGGDNMQVSQTNTGLPIGFNVGTGQVGAGFPIIG